MKRQPQLFVRKYGESEWVLLDLYHVDTIKMNLRVQDVTDPTVAVSSYSQTFRVPNTSSNGVFFQQVFNVNQTFFDTSKKAQAYINDNGEFFVNGNITLLNVYQSEKTAGIEYEISFMAETSDFASQIGVENKGFLTDLDLSDYNHPLNYENVTKSWRGNLFQGDVLYPLIEWGYGYNGSGANTTPVQSTISIGAVKSFTSSSNPLKLEQFKPALRVKAIWDAIFANTEYTYESEFLGTNTTGAQYQPASAKDFFMNLYMISEAQARPELTSSIGWKGNGNRIVAYNNQQNSISGINATEILINNELYDYGNNYNLTTREFLISASGTYSFRWRGIYRFDPFFNANQVSGDPKLMFLIVDADTNQPIFSDEQILSVIPDFGDVDITLTYNFNQSFVGKNIRFFAKLYGVTIINPDPNNRQNYDFTVIVNKYSLETVLVPGEVNPSAALPNQIKQIDFIRSVIERFKLVFEPSKTKPKHFIITPWNDWILSGSIVDWTSKLNGDKDYKITPLFQTQARYTTFKDQEDSDYLNFYFTQSWKQTYGQRNMDSQIETIKGTKQIQGIFAPLPIGPIGKGEGATGPLDIAAETFLIPHIAKDEVTNNGPGKRTPIQPKLRLGYYNPGLGLVNSSIGWYIDNAGTPVPQTKHPLISSYYPTPYAGDTFPKTLDWQPVQGSQDTKINYLPFIPNLSGPGAIKNPSGIVSEDCFNSFWERWYKATYGQPTQVLLPNGETKTISDYSVLFEGNFILNYNDVKNLRYNDIIFVKDAYYLINSIDGYEIGEVSECKVQLFKINNLGLPFPPLYQPITDVCFSNNSICEAECCHTQNSVSTFFVTDPENLVVGTPFFVDVRGTTLASPGWYRYGFFVYVIGDQGTVTSIIPIGTSECICVGPIFPKNLCYYPLEDGEACLACCCQGENVDVWMSNNTDSWYTNLNFYSDYAGYGKAADGWYSDGDNFVKIINGQSQQSGSCDSCICIIYDLTPINLCYGATKCDAVCCTAATTPTYFINDPDVGSATMLYQDQIGTIADAGFYMTGFVVLQVNSLGEIIAQLDPSDCYPCDNETINVHMNFYSWTSGTGAFQIEKSYDSINWLPLYDKDIATVPAKTQFTTQKPIAPATYVRGKLLYGKNHDTGTFATTIYQTNALLNTQNTVRYTPYSYTPPQFSLGNLEYKFIANLTGSDIDCGLTGVTAVTCTDPSCIIDDFNSVYNVNSDLDVCCDPLIVTDDGIGSVNNATYYIDSTCVDPPPPPPVCYTCEDSVVGNYEGNDYHAYPNYYICDDIVSSNLSIRYSGTTRPNRFSIYDFDGNLLTTTGWVGFANYAGPWGASLNTISTGTLSVVYQTGLYVTVEAGPADPANPLADAFNFRVLCTENCATYTNESPISWTGDWQDCNGNWHYVETVGASESICAIIGTVFTIIGSDLIEGAACNS